MENQVHDNVLIKRIICIAVAVMLIVAAFAAGYLTHKLSRNGEISSYEWALKTIAQNYYGEFDAEEAGELSLKAIAQKLDPYSEYYTAEEYEELKNSNAGQKSGIGISYNFIPDVGARIISVLGSSPAYAAGIRAGVTITGGLVNGEVKKFNKDELADFINGFGTGEEFTLCSSSGKNYVLKKSFYKASYTVMYTANNEYYYEQEGENKLALKVRVSDYMNFLPEKTAYIKLNQFYGTAADEFGILLQNFNAQKCTSLILDLRNNGGGYVSVMGDISGYFTSGTDKYNGVCMTAEYKNGRKEYAYAEKHEGNSLFPADAEIYVLANSGTASASEALTGVLVSYGILKYENIFVSDFSQEYIDFVKDSGGEVKTKRTYGKGIMQSTFENRATKEALKLTTARIYWPNGKCIHDVGLTEADGCRLAPAEWAATEDDAELKYVVKTIFG